MAGLFVSHSRTTGPPRLCLGPYTPLLASFDVRAAFFCSCPRCAVPTLAIQRWRVFSFGTHTALASSDARIKPTLPPLPCNARVQRRSNQFCGPRRRCITASSPAPAVQPASTQVEASMWASVQVPPLVLIAASAGFLLLAKGASFHTRHPTIVGFRLGTDARAALAIIYALMHVAKDCREKHFVGALVHFRPVF